MSREYSTGTFISFRGRHGIDRRRLLHVGVLLVMTLLMFGDVLFVAHPPVLSIANTDTYRQFLPLRTFTYAELKHGNVPLWNPHIFSGTPCLGNFESAVFYPFNAVFLAMSPERAINLLFALHVFLGGFFMYAWLSHRRLDGRVSLFGALLMMFSGSFFLHLFPGHLSNICSMAWVPLLLLSAEKISDTLSFRWLLIALAAVVMQILGGHIQYVYYAGLVVIIYAALLAGRVLPVLLRWGAVYAAAVLLTAVQFLPALDMLSESVRTKATFEFLSLSSFPPENLFTLLSPWLFGDLGSFIGWGQSLTSGSPFFSNITGLVYWGQTLIWESSLFIGVTGFVFAVYGAAFAAKDRRRFALVMFTVCMALAMGRYTPLYSLLYPVVTAGGIFRGAGKFSYFAGLFLVMLAGTGLDAFLKDGSRGKSLAALLFGGAIVAFTGAAYLSSAARDPGETGAWYSMVRLILAKGEICRRHTEANFLPASAAFASGKVFLLALTLAALGGLMSVGKRWKYSMHAILCLGILEVFLFARGARAVFPAGNGPLMDARQFAAEHQGDFRILNTHNPNSAMLCGLDDIFGESSNLLKRYGEFLAYTQHIDPDTATSILEIKRADRLFRLLRLRYGFYKGRLLEFPGALPRALIVGKVRLIQGRDAILGAMEQKDFDPADTVILEDPPLPAPAGAGGAVAVRDISSDEVAVDAELTAPGILLLSDSYSRFWRARSLGGSAQPVYRVMPADYILTAVPLAPGRHRFVLEYDPPGYRRGMILSALSAAGLLLFIVYRLKKR